MLRGYERDCNDCGKAEESEEHVEKANREIDKLCKENVELADRVDELEKEIARLKDIIMRAYEGIVNHE